MGANRKAPLLATEALLEWFNRIKRSQKSTKSRARAANRSRIWSLILSILVRVSIHGSSALRRGRNTLSNRGCPQRSGAHG